MSTSRPSSLIRHTLLVITSQTVVQVTRKGTGEDGNKDRCLNGTGEQTSDQNRVLYLFKTSWKSLGP